MRLRAPVAGVARAARLRFADPDIERRFRCEFDIAGLPYARAAGALGALIMALFAAIDVVVAPDDFLGLWVIRGLSVAYILGTIALSYRLAPATLARVQQALLCSVAIAVGIGVAAAPHVSDVPSTYWTAGTLLVLVVMFTSVHLRFTPALAAAAVVVVCAEVSMLLQGVGRAAVIYDNFFLLAFLVVGASTCYALERLHRREFLHEEALRGAFGSYVSPDLVEQVETGDAQITGAEVEVTVLFADIRGFTSLADRLDPADAVAVLNDFYELVLPIVRRHGGHANKLLGDGLLAAFGAPLELPDHADRGLAAAAEMVQSAWRRYDGELHIGVGLSTGPVIAGTVGDAGKLDYTLIGDPVNVASRVERLTKTTGDPVLLTADTRRRLEGEWRLESRGEHQLRGKKAPTPILALPLATPADADGTLTGTLRKAGPWPTTAGPGPEGGAGAGTQRSLP